MFAEITDAGRKFYELYHNLNISHNFCEYFLFYWILAIILFYFGRQKPLVINEKLEKISKYILLPLPVITIITLQIFATGAVPHYEDEFAYLYQARALAYGEYPGLMVPDELQNTMQTDFIRINKKGHLTGIYPPGLPAFLTPFAFFKAESLFLPFLTLINTILLFLLIEKLPIKQKTPAFLLVISSVFFLFYSTLFFAQSLSLTMVSLILLRRIKNKKTEIDYVIAGLLFLIRPADGAIMFITLGLWQFFIYKKPRIHPLLFICSACVLLFLNWHNGLLSGETGLDPYRRIFPFIGYGFGANIGMNEPFGFNIYEAVKNLGAVLLSLNEALFGWPFMSLLPILLFLFALIRKKKIIAKRNFIWFGMILIICWFGFYFCYFFPGNMIGPRFHYPLFPILLIFSAIAIELFPEIRLLTIIFCFIGLWRGMEICCRDGIKTETAENPHVNVLLNGSAVLSFPMQHFNMETDKYVYVIPEHTIIYKQLFNSFYHYNDLFNQEFSFIHPADYRKNPGFFQRKFADRLRVLGTRKNND